MGGSVEVQSQLGQGSQFKLTMNCLCIVKEMKNTQILESCLPNPDTESQRLNERRFSVDNNLKNSSSSEGEIVFISNLNTQNTVKACFRHDDKHHIKMPNSIRQSSDSTSKLNILKRVNVLRASKKFEGTSLSISLESVFVK